MKHFKLPLCILLVLTLFLIPLVGCSDSDATASGEASSEASGQPAESADTADGSADTQSTTAASSFSYSEGLDENGYWEGITALDYVDLFDYEAMVIPSDAHTITDEDVQTQIESLLTEYSTSKQITDRAVADGDTVNIDYVGSVDGVEFSGGNTGGTGADVTIGVTSYIDDFLEQLIGHTPGETFNVEVTFPDPYTNNEELSGKDAVFVTTINHIVETTAPELTDEFVAENLFEEHGWTTVDEMTEGVRETLQENAIVNYIHQYLNNDAPAQGIPDELLIYQQNALVSYYTNTAAAYGITLAEYLSATMGLSTAEELIAENAENIANEAHYFLIIQAIAEDAGITVSDADVADYFAEYFNTDDYSQYEEQYGMPYLKQSVLTQLVLDYLVEHATLA